MLIFPETRSQAYALTNAPALEPTRNRLLESIPAPECATLWAIGEEVALKKGDLITQKRTAFRNVYFPEDAVFSFVTELNNGSRVEAGTVGNEGFAGMPVFLGDNSWEQRTVVQVPGRALKISAEAFLKVLPGLPVLNMRLNKYLLAYIAQVSQTTACNSQHTVAQRCARWLLATHDRAGAHPILLTQEFLAYMLGVRRPSVTVAQAEFQRKNLISYSRGKLKILDRAGLEKISCECYGVVRKQFDDLIGDHAA